MEGFEKTIVPIVPETLPKLLLIAKYASFFRRKNTIQMYYMYYMINKLCISKCLFQNQDVDLLTCIQDALGAASDCLRCICDILNAIGGGDGVCENPPQKFKKLL